MIFFANFLKREVDFTIEAIENEFDINTQTGATKSNSFTFGY